MQQLCQTIVEVLDAQAERDATAFLFLGDGETETDSRSFDALHSRAREIATHLAGLGLSGCNVLLLFHNNALFIDALLGCFYAGAVAVPVAPGRVNRYASSLTLIAKNARASAIMISAQEKAFHNEQNFAELADIKHLEIERIGHEVADLRTISRNGAAFIQYTSGSTNHPKGVVVTHANLIANLACIREAMQLSQESRFVSWLPLFHDMGLVGNVLEPLYLGAQCVMMPSVGFLQKPRRWLDAIGRYKATISGAPNFGFDLCVEKFPTADRASLDLSSWQVAFNGSEPIRPQSLERFASTFAESGFRKSSFFPCYGMAESTLFISGGPPGIEPAWETPGNPPAVSPDGQTTIGFTSCGKPAVGTRLLVVSPEPHRALPDGEVGEIWISGDSVSGGYYGGQEAQLFAATTCDEEGAFFRTGDLGFLRGGKVFVTGRLKDLIIIRGRNHYPQDIEDSVAACNGQFIKGGTVAVTLEDFATGSGLVILQEIKREFWKNAERRSLTADVREALASGHGLATDHVIFMKPGGLPRTSSGKVRRSACRQLAQAARNQPDIAEAAMAPDRSAGRADAR